MCSTCSLCSGDPPQTKQPRRTLRTPWVRSDYWQSALPVATPQPRTFVACWLLRSLASLEATDRSCIAHSLEE